MLARLTQPNRSKRRASSRAPLFAAAIALVAGVLVTGLPADALATKRDPINPLTRHFSSLQVGPGHEFRMLVIHPLFTAATAAGPETARLAAGANPDTLGFSAPSGGRTQPLRLDNLVEDRLIVIPGQIVRSDRYDLAFTEHVAVKKRAGTDAPLEVVSERAPDDEPRPERVILDRHMPPTLRWLVSPDSNERELPKVFEAWARDAGLETGRRSMADLGDGTVIKDRVGEYLGALRTLSRAPPGLQTVGYAAILDGAPLIVETFADGQLFTKIWPSLVRALAVEAAVEEARAALLDQELAPSGQPDRLLSAVRAMLLSFYERAPEIRRAQHTGNLFTVGTPRGTLRGLVLDRSEFVHAVMVTDPRKRGTEEEDEFEPGVIRRKARPTEAEKRWLDRREKRKPPAPGSGPIPTPQPDPPPIPLPGGDPR
jgi:hypothetical protein